MEESFHMAWFNEITFYLGKFQQYLSSRNSLFLKVFYFFCLVFSLVGQTGDGTFRHTTFTGQSSTVLLHRRSALPARRGDARTLSKCPWVRGVRILTPNLRPDLPVHQMTGLLPKPHRILILLRLKVDFTCHIPKLSFKLESAWRIIFY